MVSVFLISSFLLKNLISPMLLPFSGAPDRLGVSLDWMCLFTHLAFHEARVQEQKETCS